MPNTDGEIARATETIGRFIHVATNETHVAGGAGSNRPTKPSAASGSATSEHVVPALDARDETPLRGHPAERRA